MQYIGKVQGAGTALIDYIKADNKRLWLSCCLAICFAVAIVILATSYLRMQHELQLEQAFLQKMNYDRVNFNQFDAIGICRNKTMTKIGDQLLRLTLDPLSTRYEDDKDVFFIAFRADVGELSAYDEKLVFCHVNPETFLVSYYREQMLHTTNLRSKNLKFFR